MLSFMNSRKHNIWKAAREGNKETISRLLPQATAEDLQYEEKVIIQYYIFVFLSCVYIPYISYICTDYFITLFLLQHKLYTVRIIQDGWKMPALMVAAYKGHLEIVQMLLQSKKVDVDQESSAVSILNLYYYYYYYYYYY